MNVSFSLGKIKLAHRCSVWCDNGTLKRYNEATDELTLTACPRCDGNGHVLTADGDELLKFIATYRDRIDQLADQLQQEKGNA